MAGVCVKPRVGRVAVAGLAQREHDVISNRKVFHFRAALHNLSRALMAQHERVLEHDVHMRIVNHLHIGAVAETAGPDPDERFVLRELRGGYIVHNLKFAGRGHNDSLHNRVSSVLQSVFMV